MGNWGTQAEHCTGRIQCSGGVGVGWCQSM